METLTSSMATQARCATVILLRHSFLHRGQDKLISLSSDKDVMRYAVGIQDSNPLESSVCPGARLTSTDVSLPNHVYQSYTDFHAGPEHFSVPFEKVDPV